MTDTRDIEQLLPWYVNGTLDETERARVESHLADNPAARAEVARLQTLAQHVKQDAAEVPSPGEFGLNRLLKAVKEEESQTAPARTNWWRQAAAVAALLVIVVQAGVIYQQVGAPTDIQPLGAVEAPSLRIMVDDEVTIGAVGEALRSMRAEIVSGPSALGLYTVSPVGDDTDIGQLADALAQQPWVIQVQRP